MIRQAPAEIPQTLVNTTEDNEFQKVVISNANSPFGINLSRVKDWSTEQPFKDIFKSAREWNNGTSETLDLDENGWVRSLAKGQIAYAYMLLGLDGNFPGGHYVVLYDGEGELAFDRDAVVVENEPGRILIDVMPQEGITLIIQRTNADNYIRNIRLMEARFEDNYEENPWNPEFLERWKSFGTLRFMEWMQINNSEIEAWFDRPKMNDYTLTIKGIALEYMVDLANRLQAEPWFTMPHKANDEYVRNFAVYVKENLDPGLRSFIEYSNETWNGSFSQRDYTVEQGKVLGYSGTVMQIAAQYHSHRAKEIFSIWTDVFGGPERVFRVVAGFHSGGANYANLVLMHEDIYQVADAYAIAPYFGHDYGGKLASEVREWTLDQLFEDLSIELDKTFETTQAIAKAASAKGVPLIAYEGGQHLVGTPYNGREYQEDNLLKDLFIAANRDARMKDIYLSYLNDWKLAGGRWMAIFSSMSKPTKWGSWGLLEHMFQSPEEAPKYTAVSAFIADNPRWWNDDVRPQVIVQNPVETAEAKLASEAITIDGKLDEALWNIEYFIEKDVHGTGNNESTVGVLWDKDFLYIGVRVLDDILINESIQAYQDDSVEIYLDGNHNKGLTYDEADRQYIVRFDDPVLFEQKGKTDGVKFAQSQIDGGYEVEIAIPWTQLHLTEVASGIMIGLDIGVNDDDTDYARDSQTMWSGTADNWQSTERFGDLTLIE